MGSWTFLTNHGQVLLAIANAQDSTEREIALRVGITERAVQRIITDLEQAGYLTRIKEGRRNHYRLRPDLPLRHQLAQNVSVGELLRVLTAPDAAIRAEIAESAGRETTPTGNGALRPAASVPVGANGLGR